MQSNIQLPNPPVNRSRLRWAESRRYLRRFRAAPDLAEFATDFFDRFPDCPPSCFHVSRGQLEREVEKAFGESGYMVRLLSMLEQPAFVTLHADDLDIDPDLEHYTRYHAHDTVATWRYALTDAVNAPLWFRLEVGAEHAVIHAHLISDQDACAGLGVQRDIFDAEKLHRYLKKSVPWSPEHLAVYLEAKRRSRRNLPRKSGTHQVPNARTWRPLDA